MEEWALRGMQRWPNVPALFGWLGLDRRGRWLIKGEVITRPQIVDTISRNYEADAHGRWFFQNGPQRGFVTLEYAPFVLHAQEDALMTHAGQRVNSPSAAYLDESGSLVVQTEYGAGLLVDTDLEWALERMNVSGAPVDEEALAAALALRSREQTLLRIAIGEYLFPVRRLDQADVPGQLGFVRDPQPLEGESVSTRVAD